MDFDVEMMTHDVAEIMKLKRVERSMWFPEPPKCQSIWMDG